MDSGDPSLLIWSIPASIAASGATTQAYVLPLKSRPGGFLLAVPSGVIADDSVLEALLSVEEQEMLGPSTSFDAVLIGEDEQGEVAEVGATCKVLVIDLLDSALEQIRDYDPVTDAFESILPFHDDHPQCIPQVSSIADELAQWIEKMAFERLNFYSAREELPSPSVKGVAAKKAPGAKRTGKVTTAMLADQVSALSAQMQLISQQYSDFQKATSHGFAKNAGGVPHGPMIAKVPGLSSGMQLGIPAKSATVLVGPPPKTKARVQVPPVQKALPDERRCSPIWHPERQLTSCRSSNNSSRG